MISSPTAAVAEWREECVKEEKSKHEGINSYWGKMTKKMFRMKRMWRFLMKNILISHWKNIYSGTSCRRLKLSGRLNHFCRKINFVAEPEFMAESETARNANSKWTTVLMILGAKRSSTIATIHLPMLVVALNKEGFHKYIITERNLQDPTSFFAETSSWQRIRVFFSTTESIINKWKSTLLWWGLAMLALRFVLSKRNKDIWMQREEEGTRKGSKATLWSTHLEEAFLLWKNSTWRK